MKKHIAMLVAGAAALMISTGNAKIASAGEYIDDIPSIFGLQSRYWLPRSGSDKGIILIYRRPQSAVLTWNGEWTFHGTWEYTDNRHRRLCITWEERAPVDGHCFSIRENEDPDKQYTANALAPGNNR